ncbi:MAG: hypothetical protein IPK26_09570 [Planctomycetes bacterium]|nr:hypothetical protein [Planctomycetota bacterium]
MVVFLHGFAIQGSAYSALGNAWASRGMVVVLSNTAQFDNVGQEHDGRALHGAVLAANATVGGPFAGAFDVGRMALAGHSMGGGNVANVLANNPGYRCGLAFAPVLPRGSNAGAVTTPLAIVVGAGDTITPAATQAQPFYQAATATTGLRMLYLLDNDCTHTNVAGLFLGGGVGTQVFERATGVGLGFLRHFLAVDITGLEGALGDDARQEPRRVGTSLLVEQPQVWTWPAMQVGATARLSVASEPGLGGIVAAPTLAPPTPTPFGELLVDRAAAFVAVIGIADSARRIDGGVTVPNDPVFAGMTLALQAFGAALGRPLALGSAVVATVSP